MIVDRITLINLQRDILFVLITVLIACKLFFIFACIHPTAGDSHRVWSLGYSYYVNREVHTHKLNYCVGLCKECFHGRDLILAVKSLQKYPALVELGYTLMWHTSYLILAAFFEQVTKEVNNWVLGPKIALNVKICCTN